MENFQARLDEWVATLQKQMDDYYREKFPSLEREILVQDPGRKYVRIWKRRESEDTSRGSAFAFIDTTNGNILRPATYKAPAKHARGNLFDASKGLGQVGVYGPNYMR